MIPQIYSFIPNKTNILDKNADYLTYWSVFVEYKIIIG